METWKCLQTDDSRTTDWTSSSRSTLRTSSGGRAARPKATGRAMASLAAAISGYASWSLKIRDSLLRSLKAAAALSPGHSSVT